MTIARCPVRDTGQTPPMPAHSTGSSRNPSRPTAGRRARRDMTIAVVVIVVVAVAVLIAGLCRAAADTKEVTEDTGEYE